MVDALITGGSGFIGSSLARYLTKEGLTVETLDVVPQPEDLRDLGIPHSICDMRSYDALRASLRDVELVIHTAIVQIPRINQDRKAGFEVNVQATENLCRLVDSLPVRGLILAGSWHVIGESELSGVVTEGFGYRPDKVENRARLYALSKIGQELIVRLFSEFSDKTFGVLRLGTVLGEGMPSGTAASTFIDQVTSGKDLTPFKHSMHRPIAYVSIRDVLKGFHRFSMMILSDEYAKGGNSLENIANILYPDPVTVLELAHLVRDTAERLSGGKIRANIHVVDKGLPSPFDELDKTRVSFDVSQSKALLGFEDFISPAAEIERILEGRLRATQRPSTRA